MRGNWRQSVLLCAAHDEHEPYTLHDCASAPCTAATNSPTSSACNDGIISDDSAD
jgi:hypothetical protein